MKEIIQLHGENINVVSTEGVGTEFIFSLSKVEEQANARQSRDHFALLKILSGNCDTLTVPGSDLSLFFFFLPFIPGYN